MLQMMSLIIMLQIIIILMVEPKDAENEAENDASTDVDQPIVLLSTPRYVNLLLTLKNMVFSNLLYIYHFM